MNYRSQVACAWCGPLFAFGFFVGLLPMAHFIIPPAPTGGTASIAVSPSWSAAQLAEFLSTDTVLKRLGMLVAMLATGLLAPYFAVIAIQMKRIEKASPVLAYAQLVAGACTVLAIVLPIMLFQGILYRPDRDPAITQALNDVAWLTFLGLTSTLLIQSVLWGAVILQDKAQRPVFPRWWAYFNFLCVAGGFPGGLVPFFKEGPLAWNGLIIWGVGALLFFTWILLGARMVLAAVRHQRDEASVAPGTVPVAV